MPKYPIYKYEFTVGEETVLCAVGETKYLKSGDILCVHKIKNNGLMHTLWFSINGGTWQYLENGKRTKNGTSRVEFKKFVVDYPQIYPKGSKVREVELPNEI